jgi:hypothetical protein
VPAMNRVEGPAKESNIHGMYWGQSRLVSRFPPAYAS